MRKLLATRLLITSGGVLVTLAVLAADVWDVQTSSDNSFSTTQNELVHGSLQVHDLAVLPGPVADVDWYRLAQKPYSSYEITIDAVSGDVVAPSAHQMQRMAANGTSILQSDVSESPNIGSALSMRFMNNTAAAVNDQLIRVFGAACSTTCGVDDVYRIRMRETTIRVARFNNSGTQLTVLLTQNASTVPVNVNIHFWDTAGALANTRTVALAAKALDVFATSTAAPGVSGHITVAHDGPHGTVTVKSVALEPSTGFSFDTPGVYRPY